MPAVRSLLKLSYSHRVLALAMLAGLPGVVVSLVLVWKYTSLSSDIAWTISGATIGAWLFIAFALRQRIVFPLQTVSNVVAAIREGDFSVRGREGYGAQSSDTLEELTREVNALAETVHAQRLGALEATALLRKVIEEIEVAVFSFDSDRRLKLLNRAAERLLNTTAERAMELDAATLGLASYLDGPSARVVDAAFPGRTGRWEVRKSTFRQGGKPHQLLVLSDLTRTLREEELQAWQRIVRVIGHELNNSLTPIKSIAGTLQTELQREHRNSEWEDDLTRGLAIIASRSESLARFISAYTRVARMPEPRLQEIELDPLIRRISSLETRVEVGVRGEAQTKLKADPDQLEQLLINLIRNAVDASIETGGNVAIEWTRTASYVEICIEDAGPGIANLSNLFVPFFTTKPGGSGIGLFLSRQIAEAHNGFLTLEPRNDRSGSVARLRLPLSQ